MHLLPSFLLLLSILSPSSSTSDGDTQASEIGLCYGEYGDNLPKPSDAIKLIQKLHAARIKIYGVNPDILKSIQSTDLEISIMLPNDLIPKISADQTLADDWVRQNVAAFYPNSKIRQLLVGNEVLSAQPSSTWYQLVPAMRKIWTSMGKLGLQQIRIGTPFSMECLEVPFPPSNGTFRSTVRDEVIKPLLEFLSETKSYFYADAYTYFTWVSQPHRDDIGYALLEATTNFTYTDPGTGITYDNLLEEMLDALVFAMKRLGYPDIPIYVAETGWPSAGDPDQIGASVENAATYNRNVLRRFGSGKPFGTPARPGRVVPVMLFALFNENNKPGQGTERNFGLLYANGSNVYPFDFSGNSHDPYPTSSPKPMLAPEPPSAGKPKLAPEPPSVGKCWCVAKAGANETALSGSASWACDNGKGSGMCDQTGPGGACYGSSSRDKASYAFSAYWAQMKSVGGTCDFDGLAETTKNDPSFGSCKFPSVNL